MKFAVYARTLALSPVPVSEAAEDGHTDAPMHIDSPKHLDFSVFLEIGEVEPRKQSHKKAAKTA